MTSAPAKTKASDSARLSDGNAADQRCRMCLDDGESWARIACPECGACFACASDDCGICIDRINYMVAEHAKHRAATEEDGQARYCAECGAAPGQVHRGGVACVTPETGTEGG